MAVPGTVTVSARATDDVGVTKLELYNYGTLVASATTGSLSYSWNTANVANGSHALLSRAYDAARNVGTSSTVTVSNSGAGGQQLIGNLRFENGSGNPAPWVATLGVITTIQQSRRTPVRGTHGSMSMAWSTQTPSRSR